MNKFIIWLLIIFVAFPANSGTFNEKNIMVNKIKRSYVTKFPNSYDVDQKIPLIIALHGGGSNWKKFNRATTRNTLEKEANRNNMLLIFPEGKNNHWSDGREKHLQGQQTYDDVKFISELIDLAIDKYNVDPDKVFVTGMSNGGFMAIRLAIELTEKISAVVSISAQMSLKIQFLQLDKPISFMLINGTNDPIVPYHGGEMKLFKLPKSRGKVLSSTQTINYFVKNNKCAKPAVRSSQDHNKFDMTTLDITEYKECKGNTQVTLIKVNSGGHTWPGGRQYLPVALIGHVSKEVNASKLLVDFFLANSK
ncbi:MAG: prolyl oligopeptidase family serine peptidase [Alcanivoracaceae bacterium]|nr:prolyl oligopeptidase family serine peptidase [Alcanivoracaceae bacterium]